MSLKPIETRYGGCHFRSRIEARWAVFFDALRLPWEYEFQGFDLGDGSLYLPDFWLPSINTWFEVKGTPPSEAEQHRLMRFAELLPRTPHLRTVDDLKNSQYLKVAVGGIPEPDLLKWDNDRVTWDVRPPAWGPGIWRVMFGFVHAARWCNCTCGNVWVGWGMCPPCHLDHDKYAFRAMDPDRCAVIEGALIAARSARFEHGESG